MFLDPYMCMHVQDLVCFRTMKSSSHLLVAAAREWCIAVYEPDCQVAAQSVLLLKCEKTSCNPYTIYVDFGPKCLET